jgi:hypothetical protein
MWRDVRWALSLFLVGLGAKFWLILKYGSPLPFWDQWDAEAANVYSPYLTGHLSLADLIRPHNEHRVLVPRLYCLLLLVLNGQWDAELQMMANGLIHAATLTGLAWLLARFLGRQYWPVIWPPIVVAMVLPFAWENTLGGGIFSQSYFLIIFSLLAILGLGLCQPWSTRWWLGACASTAALFTGASGFLAAVTVVVLLSLDGLKERGWRRFAPTLAICAVIIVSGVLLKPDVPHHHVLEARSAREFLVALGKNLAWPAPWRCAPLNLFPLVALGWLYVSGGAQRLPADRLVLGIGIWVTLQSLAAAYARGAGGGPPAWRYMDSLSLLMIVNCTSILLLTTRHGERLRVRALWYAVFALWGFACLSGLRSLTHEVRRHILPRWEAAQGLRLRSARQFIATRDARAFDTDDPFNIPFPNVKELTGLLQRPELRKILPACVREPIRIRPCGGDPGAFVTNGCALDRADPPWDGSLGSYSGGGTKPRGTFEGVAMTESKLPFLEIPVAGDLGKPGLSLDLIETKTGKTIPIEPIRPPGGTWQNVCVKAPAGEFRLLARDDSETGWFAFKEPREMGRLSYWSMRALEAWIYFLFAGMAGLLVMNVLSAREMFARTRTR